MRKWLRITFVLYVIFLTFLLVVHNPFALVPVDEETVEGGFGIGLTPHILAFLLLAVLGLCARFRHPGWLFLGMIAYAGATEILQGLLNPWFGRYCDIYDFVENLQGLAYGGAGWWIVNVGIPRVMGPKKKSE